MAAFVFAFSKSTVGEATDFCIDIQGAKHCGGITLIRFSYFAHDFIRWALTFTRDNYFTVFLKGIEVKGVLTLSITKIKITTRFDSDADPEWVSIF